MIWFVLVLAAVLLVILEHNWADISMGAMKLKQSCDRLLAEPGEMVTCTSTVENHSRLPLPFVRLRESFPASAQLVGDPQWVKRHTQQGLKTFFVEERMSVLPRKAVTRKVQLRFSDRGVYELGSYQISAGDLLGLKEENRSGSGQTIVVMPKLPENQSILQAFGGFLGDISVRRFILEDPILTVGFRDYTGREPLKAVSWKRTAQTGKLQVKEFDHTAQQTVMVLLNVEGGKADELEACFSLMRYVCQELERRTIPYAIRTNGNLPGPVGKLNWMAEGLGHSHLQPILYALGRADDTCFYSFRYLAEQTLRHRKNHESYIVITPNQDVQFRGVIRKLETVVGSSLCVLYGSQEVEKT